MTQARGGVVPDGAADHLIHGHGAQRTDQAARPDGVAHALVNAVFFRGVHVVFHLVEGAGQDGQHHEIGAGQRFFQGVHRLELPAVLVLFPGEQLVADDLVGFCGVEVNVVQINFTADALFQREVAHQAPGPAAGAAADVCDMNSVRLIVAYFHHKPFLF